MDWLEIKVFTTTEGIDHVGGILLMLGINGYMVEDKSDFEEFLNQTEPHWDYVDESLNYRKTAETSVIFYLTDDANGREQLSLVRTELERIKSMDESKILGRLEIEISGLKQCDWENGWKKYFKPFTVGQKIIIIPSWENVPEGNTRTVLSIDPGMSFGTGQHHTTRLCIEAIERNIKKSDKVLDLGCGSGILSIAALLLGAESAIGVDIDPLAVDVSRENAAKNGFNEEKYTAYCTNILSEELPEQVNGKYDIVAANIVADVLIAFAPVFKKYMSDKTKLICSGIISHRLEDVKNALELNGYKVLAEFEESEWHCVEAELK